jgi:hypothetical protein
MKKKKIDLSKHVATLMKKVSLPVCIIYRISTFLFFAAPGFIFSSSAMSELAPSPHNYNSCAEIQNYMNKTSKHNNKYESFEKSQMNLSHPMLSYYKYGSSLYCSGGFITTRYQDGTKRICKGTIEYYSQRDAIDQGYIVDHFWYFGGYRAGHAEKDYCRWSR